MDLNKAKELAVDVLALNKPDAPSGPSVAAPTEQLAVRRVDAASSCSASYDVYAHLRDIQALFLAENEQCIMLAEAGERLATEYQRMRAALVKIEEICDRPSDVWDVVSEALKPNTVHEPRRSEA